VLGRNFYARSALQVARACIGKVLVREIDGLKLAGRIVEAEAYMGPKDRAAHSWGGRRTARTEAMFGEPGRAYVFFVYGIHWHMNLVAAEPGKPEAVLIRALEPVWGVDAMAEKRRLPTGSLAITNGPGKLCQALCIHGGQYGHDLTRGNGLYLLDAPTVKVERSPRIGIDYAGSWADKPWRFSEVGNRYVSKVRGRERT
jgi:DNA-3-methyladenine glycosylase